MKKKPFFSKDKRSILWICIAGSALLHFGVVLWLYTSPPAFFSGFQNAFSKEDPTQELQSSVLEKTPESKTPVLFPFTRFHVADESGKLAVVRLMDNLVEIPQLEIPSFTLAPEETTSLSPYNQLKKELQNIGTISGIPTVETIEDQTGRLPKRSPLQATFSYKPAYYSLRRSFTAPIVKKKTKTTSLNPSYNARVEPLFMIRNPVRTYPFFQDSSFVSKLTDYSLMQIFAMQERDDFTFDVKIMEEDENGYVFSATLKPLEINPKKQMKQNIYFVIDHTNSIDKLRFALYKRGVEKALSVLKPEDKFNIVFVDKKIVKFSQDPLFASEKNIRNAIRFIQKQEHGSWFAVGDVYTMLPTVFPKHLADDELHTAILLSDGECSLKPDQKQKIISKWIAHNVGKVALYTATASGNNNLLLLDLISRTSRGSLLYSDTNASFPRKLTKLVSTFSKPIAKDIVATIIETDKTTPITLYCDGTHLPNLYSERPLTIVGHTKDPQDFTLLIQGHDGINPFSIRKRISLQNSTVAKNLSKPYASELAYLFYKQFLTEGKALYLNKAKKLFQESGSEIGGR